MKFFKMMFISTTIIGTLIAISSYSWLSMWIGLKINLLSMMMWEIIPNPGSISMYTSGCPKNQNSCWYSMGSPPPAGSKKDVLMFRSVNSMVMAPASTGSDSNNSMAVITTAHTNKDMRSGVMPDGRMLITVEMKFTAPSMEEIPASCDNMLVSMIIYLLTALIAVVKISNINHGPLRQKMSNKV